MRRRASSSSSSKLVIPLALFAGAALGLACGSTPRDTSPFPTVAEAGPGDTTPQDGGPLFPSGDSGPTTSPDGCSEAAKLVYVVSAENDLYSFKPDTLTFTKIGRLDCRAAALASPNSMAVDRSGNAWVNYSDGTLFKVSTRDATCASTPFAAGQDGFTKFGMAFAANTPGSTAETLYVAGLQDILSGGRAGLGKIDLTSMKLTFVGDYSGDLRGRGAELTGTGDAKLYGFYTTDPATLARVDVASGATSDTKSLTGVRTGDAWAFSFWGGDFWFYTAESLQESKVTRLRSSDGNIQVVVPKVGGFRIVGAGVSTCAPTAPPR